jgi:hypothetical protein
MGKYNKFYNELDTEDIFDTPEDRWEPKDMCESVKKKVNGKKKGDSYERLVAKDLSKKFHDTFRRVPQSGAIMGGQNRFYNKNLRVDAQEILAGDIITPKWFPFTIECKNYKDTPKIRNLLSNGDKDLDEWIKQAKGESEVARKPWIIVFKVTNIRGKQFVVSDFKQFSEVITDTKDYPEEYIMYKGSIIIDYSVFFDKLFHHFDPRGEEPEVVEPEQIEIEDSVVEKILD